MGGEWPIVKLEDVAEVIDSRHQTPVYSDSGFPMVRVVDVKGGFLTLLETKKVSAEIYKDFSKGRDPQLGDLVFSRVGSYGNVSYVATNEKFCLGQNTALIVPKDKSRFLYYQLISPQVKAQIEEQVVGAVQKTISLKSIRNLELSQPSEFEKNQISSFLASLDNKITLNRQLNQTLEQMAQALFKSWFVDFDPVIDNALAAGNVIPDDLQDRAERRQLQLAKADHKPLLENIRKLFPSEFELTESLGWVPLGWGVKKAEDIAHVAIGKTPPRNQSEHFSDTHDDNVVWVSIRDMGVGGVHINDSNEYLVPESVARFNVNLVPRNSVLLSFKLTLGRVCITSCDLTTNEAIASFSAFKNGIGKEFLYCYLNSFDYGSLGSTSSIATAVNSKIIKAMPILVASELVVKQFEAVTGEWFSRMEKVDFENNGLINLRDTLLPKLISGELRIPEAQSALTLALSQRERELESANE